MKSSLSSLLAVVIHHASHWSCVICHRHREMAQQWCSIISVRNRSSYWSRDPKLLQQHEDPAVLKYDRVRHVKRRKKNLIRYDTSDKSKGIFVRMKDYQYCRWYNKQDWEKRQEKEETISPGRTTYCSWLTPSTTTTIVDGECNTKTIYCMICWERRLILLSKFLLVILLS